MIKKFRGGKPNNYRNGCGGKKDYKGITHADWKTFFEPGTIERMEEFMEQTIKDLNNIRRR